MCIRLYYQCKIPGCDELGFPVVIHCTDYLVGCPCQVTDEVIVGSDHSCSICYYLFPQPVDRMTQVLEQMALQGQTAAEQSQPPPPASSPASVEQMAQGFEKLNLRVLIAEESLEEAMKRAQLEDQKKDQGGGSK